MSVIFFVLVWLGLLVLLDARLPSVWLAWIDACGFRCLIRKRAPGASNSTVAACLFACLFVRAFTRSLAGSKLVCVCSALDPEMNETFSSKETIGATVRSVYTSPPKQANGTMTENCDTRATSEHLSSLGSRSHHRASPQANKDAVGH
eukprot:m.871287 g.871287  ORF g.871287 m.871287 type:complete len:148 (+) comp59761_c1_seq6:1353-1796(+)